MVAFAVDDVDAVTDVLPAVALAELFPDALLAEAGDPAARGLIVDGIHPLLSAIGRAFAEHRRLVLTPDAVWLTIAAGIAQHVRLNAERLRPQLVGHAGRRRLEVITESSMPLEYWRDLVAAVTKQLASASNETDLFECGFTTSTDVDRLASQIVMLDAYSPYFTYWARFVCGIPSITLTGTVDDWRTIRSRIDRLSVFDLDPWMRSLVPIADQFVRAADGDVDTAFWRRIYSPADAYGGEVVTGWATRFYPYLTGKGTLDYPNPMLDLPIDEPRDITSNDVMGYRGPGLRTDSVPATLSRVIVNINDQIRADNQVVALHAGLIGVGQDEDGALRPLAGWYLAPAQIEIEDVLDRIVRGHETTAPEPARLMFATGELQALYRRVGSASLFGGAWRLIPASNLRGAPRGAHTLKLVPIFELAEGRCLAAAEDHHSEQLHWVLGRFEEAPLGTYGVLNVQYLRLIDEPAGVPVYGRSLAHILDAALDSGGDIEHLQTGYLDELDRVTRWPEK